MKKKAIVYIPVFREAIPKRVSFTHLGTGGWQRVASRFNRSASSIDTALRCCPLPRPDLTLGYSPSHLSHWIVHFSFDVTIFSYRALLPTPSQFFHPTCHLYILGLSLANSTNTTSTTKLQPCSSSAGPSLLAQPLSLNAAIPYIPNVNAT